MIAAASTWPPSSPERRYLSRNAANDSGLAEFVDPDGPNLMVTDVRSRSSLTEPRSFGPVMCTSALNEKLIRTRPQTKKQTSMSMPAEIRA